MVEDTVDRNTPGVYAIRSSANGRQYIGSSANIRSRWNLHKSQLRRGLHANTHLQNAWSKYGEDAFEFIVLEECAVSDLIEREQYHIDIVENKYNIRPVANSNLGMRHSEETKARIGAANKGLRRTEEQKERIHQASIGREVSAEAREKIRQAHLGRAVSPETREKLRQASTGHRHTDETRAKLKGNKSRTGKPHTSETKAKISAANKGNKSRTGQTTSAETRAKMSKAAKERWARKRAESGTDNE